MTQEGEPPTLGKEDGVGVLQFSVARHAAGVGLAVGSGTLRELLLDFGRTHGWGEPTRICQGRGLGQTHVVSGDFLPAGECVRVWYLAAGGDVAFITYVTLLPDDPRVAGELREASVLIGQLELELV